MSPDRDSDMITNVRTNELCKSFWLWRMKNFPEFSTTVGETKFNDRLTDISISGFQRRFNEAKEMLNKVDTFMEELSKNQFSCPHLEVLQFELKTFVEGYLHHSYLFPITNLDGPQITFPILISSMPRESTEDFENILTRLRLLSSHLDDAMDLMKEGIRKRLTLHLSSIDSAITQFRNILTLEFCESPFFVPFLNKPSFIGNEEWKELVDQCYSILKRMTYPSVEKMINFLVNEYYENLRPNVSIASLPNGMAMYQACLKYHTSTDLTPDQLHDIGLREVSRIQHRANKILEDVNFEGTFVEISKQLRDKVTSEDDKSLVRKFSDIYEETSTRLPTLFDDIPLRKCSIKTTSNKSGCGGFYQNGNNNEPGKFFINTNKIKGMTFLSHSLALHEMIPGHHLQSDVALQATNVPRFRKFRESGNYSCIPARFPLYTAFMEGWGLYAEYLGEELGMYKTPLDLLGRLVSELFRAARLVVDTGVHAYNWPKEKAVSYLIEVVGMREDFALSEVNRYITWPGQACSYKIGEIKIIELRDQARELMGDRFDIKEFHNQVIGYGEVPLHVMQRNVEIHINNT